MTIVGQRKYAVEQRLVLTNVGPGEPEKQNVWVALIRDFPPYQHVESVVVSPADYTTVVDEYGNHYAEFDFSKQPVGTSKTIQIETRVVVDELAYDLSACQGEMPNEFNQPELHIESSNPQIVDLAGNLATGTDSVCDEGARVLRVHRRSSDVHVQRQELGCSRPRWDRWVRTARSTPTLLIALSRAQGIPARYFEGLRYVGAGAPSSVRIEHAWPDVYLPGIGWVALDPTLGRVHGDRDTYFAHYTPEHIIVTMGVNPSTLRGTSYWTHLYWPGDATKINAESIAWKVDLVSGGG